MENIDSTLRQICQDIEEFSPLRSDSSKLNGFQLSDDPEISDGLSGSAGAFIVRTLLRKLGSDENRLTNWKLENKFWQYKILDHYIPGCMAHTISLSEILSQPGGYQSAIQLCENGYFIKSTYGDSSGRGHRFDQTEELPIIKEENSLSQNGQEKWVLQKKLNLQSEFRIHSFNNDIIYGLTFMINGIPASSRIAETYLKDILSKLPDGLTKGQLIGWDIAISKTGRPYIIEANITGLHKHYQKGFQTSGYFGDVIFGPLLCAWLNAYFKLYHNFWIQSVHENLSEKDSFFDKFHSYISILKLEHLEYLKARRINKPKSTSAIIYFGNSLDEQSINFLKYLSIQFFAENYYIIVSKKLINEALKIEFPIQVNAFFLVKNNKEAVIAPSESNCDEQKIRSSSDAIKLIEDDNYIIV